MFISPKYAIQEGWIKGVEESQIQPNAIDFTLDKVFNLGWSEFCLFKEEKQHRTTAEQTTLTVQEKECFTLHPRTTYDCSSDMFVDLPEGIAATLIIRSTLNRNGVFLTSGLYDSGFKGTIGFSLHNNSNGFTRLEKGVCVGQIIFHKSDSEGLYKGQYNTKEGEHWNAGSNNNS